MYHRVKTLGMATLRRASLIWACIYLTILTQVPPSGTSRSSGLLGRIVYAINAGGQAHVDSDGIKYEGDALAEGIVSDYGKRIWTIGRVHPEDSILYQTERYSLTTFGYSIPIRDDGDYVLVLKFCEVYFLNPRKKVFDVMLNGAHRIVKELDIFGEVGRGVAHEEIVGFKVSEKGTRLRVNGQTSNIKNSQLLLEFIKGELDNPKINAFYVMRGTENDVPRLPELEQEEERDWSDEDWAPEPADRDEEEDQEGDEALSHWKRRAPGPPRLPDPYLSEDSEWTSTIQILVSLSACIVVFIGVRKIIK